MRFSVAIGCERVDQAAELSGWADRGQDGGADSALDELSKPRLLLGGGAEYEDLPDQLVGRQFTRPLAFAGRPGIDHRIDRVSPAEPAEEPLVYGHGCIGGEHPARQRHALLGGLRDAEEAAEYIGRSFLLARLPRACANFADDLWESRNRQEVDEAAVTDRSREPQHLSPKRRHVDGRWDLGRALELEATGATLAGQHCAERSDRLPHLRQRLFERDAVPAFHDHVR